MPLYKIIIVLYLLVISGMTDLLKRKVYNFITFPGIILGFIVNYQYQGWSGLIESLTGFVICSVIFISIYMLGGFGAGDVKLMMALGAICGSRYIFDIILYSVITGGVLANVIILKKGMFLKSWKNVLRFFLFLIPRLNLSSEPLNRQNSITLPYAYAIAIGVLSYLYFNVTVL